MVKHLFGQDASVGSTKVTQSPEGANESCIIRRGKMEVTSSLDLPLSSNQQQISSSLRITHISEMIYNRINGISLTRCLRIY